MLDRIDSGPRRRLDSARAVGVGGDLEAEPGEDPAVGLVEKAIGNVQPLPGEIKEAASS